MTRLLAAFLLLGLVAAAPAAEKADRKEDAPKVPPAVAEFLKLTPEEFIKHFDKNKDGVLTKDELPPRLAENFEKLDKNGDGKLDLDEVTAMLKMLRQRFNIEESSAPAKDATTDGDVDRLVTRWLDRMDSNKDGKIGKDEARGPLANFFDRFDTNKDGYLDKAELRQAATIVLERQRENAGGATPQDFDSLDLNADGRLSRDELKGTPFSDAFDEIDTNKDGKIDRHEFQAYLKKQAEKNK